VILAAESRCAAHWASNHLSSSLHSKAIIPLLLLLLVLPFQSRCSSLWSKQPDHQQQQQLVHNMAATAAAHQLVDGQMQK
jgi:hypothetical protein